MFPSITEEEEKRRRWRRKKKKRRIHCHTTKLEPNHNISVNWFPLY
jgi:uncharacterized protein YndB with AHSA1/START domain